MISFRIQIQLITGDWVHFSDINKEGVNSAEELYQQLFDSDSIMLGDDVLIVNNIVRAVIKAEGVDSEEIKH